MQVQAGHETCDVDNLCKYSTGTDVKFPEKFRKQIISANVSFPASDLEDSLVASLLGAYLASGFTKSESFRPSSFRRAPFLLSCLHVPAVTSSSRRPFA